MTPSSPKKPEDTAPGHTVRDTVTVPELTLVEETIPDLKLEDTAEQQRRGLAAPSPAGGYNPYDTGSPGPPAQSPGGSQPVPEEQPFRKRTDLRKLSEWIKAQRRAEAARQEQSCEGKKSHPQRRK